MAWRCSGSSNNFLIDNLIAAGIIRSPEIADALKKVDRANYAPKQPYEDAPQVIGYSATISAPHMHAYALEYLKTGI